MSYDLSLVQDGRSVKVDKFEEGGTYIFGGSSYADLNITYNYGKFYYSNLDTVDGLRWLYGKKGKDTIHRLQSAVEALGVVEDDDYWEPTSGNAGYALNILLEWAKQYPNAIWEGD